MKNGHLSHSLSLQFILQGVLDSFRFIDNLKMLEKKIDNLCFYCEVLLQASQICNNGLFTVLGSIKKDLFQKTYGICTEERNDELPEKLSRFFHELTPYLEEASSDENVIVFLIEHLELFNQHLGPYQIEKLLHQFFPRGKDQLRAILYEAYSKRNFSSFFNSIDPILQAVQWEVPCLPTLTR